MASLKQALIAVTLLLGFFIIPLSHAYSSEPIQISSSGTITEIPPVQYELIVEVGGSGSTDPFPGSYMYDEGSLVPVDALPGSGWMLSYWLLDGVGVGSADPYTVTMDSDHNLTAVFVMETDHSKLYVEGTVIKHPVTGLPVRLQGFNIEEKDATEEMFQWMVARGFNYLRVLLFWHRLQPNSESSWDNTYLTRLDNLVNWAKQYGIYLNLVFQHYLYSPYWSGGTGFPEWMVSGYGTNRAGRSAFANDFWLRRNSAGILARQRWMDFWLFIINRYKDYSCVVAWEIFNEPSNSFDMASGCSDAIMDTFEEWTQTVRAIDPDTIIIYHSIDFTQTQGYGQSHRSVVYPNIVWTRSLYPAYSSLNIVSQYKNHFNTNLGTPFIISEIGIQSTSSSTLQSVRDFLDRCRSQLNNGYEGYAWYLYGESNGAYRGYITPRNSNGSDTAVVAILQEYM